MPFFCAKRAHLRHVEDLVRLKFRGRSGANIFIALPTHDGTVHAPFCLSLIALSAGLTANGVGHELVVIRGESLISRARNNLAADFLKSDCTHLLFLDTDLRFRPEMIQEMIAADKDVIGGAYPFKTMHEDAITARVRSGAPFDPFFGCKPVLNFANSADVNDGVVEVRDIGTGLMLIKRCVLEKMAKSRRVERYVAHHQDSFGEPRWDFFPVKVAKEKGGSTVLLSEDYSFCRTWRQMGGKIFAHLTYPVTHTGSIDYEWDVAKSDLFEADEEVPPAPVVAAPKKRARHKKA